MTTTFRTINDYIMCNEIDPEEVKEKKLLEIMDESRHGPQVATFELEINNKTYRIHTIIGGVELVKVRG